MPATRKIAVAASGGIDSLAALLLLKDQGYQVLALHALFAPDARPPGHLREICARFNIELHVIDLRAVFAQQVVAGFIAAQASGLTPNPCAICNRLVKFSALFRAAMLLGANALATGHYARLLPHPQTGRFLIAPAADNRKDQGYFLGLVNPDALAYLEFPLADLQKGQCRDLLRQTGIALADAGESQDACFLNNAAPKQFLRNQSACLALFKPGPIRLRQPGQEDFSLAQLPEIGQHQGLAAHTIGQRQGLNVPWREALYVRERHIRDNCLVAAPASMLNMRGCVVKKLNYFLPPLFWPPRLFARLRYRQPPMSCRVDKSGPRIKILLDKPHFASAPGQLATLHDEMGRLLAGGIISAICFDKANSGKCAS